MTLTAVKKRCSPWQTEKLADELMHIRTPVQIPFFRDTLQWTDGVIESVLYYQTSINLKTL